VLVWGGIDDLAQALHDAPDIVPKPARLFRWRSEQNVERQRRGPRRGPPRWGGNAYNYIEQQHPALWMIESNSTYRGWFTGGIQTGTWSDAGFVAQEIANRGALGQFFATLLGGSLKMGDSPSIGYLLHGTPDDPSQPGWGGQFVRVWDGRKTIFDRLTTAADRVEAFGVVEFALPLSSGMTSAHSARAIFDGRIPKRGCQFMLPSLRSRVMLPTQRRAARLHTPRFWPMQTHRPAAAFLPRSHPLSH
jgi:hypothetical protein